MVLAEPAGHQLVDADLRDSEADLLYEIQQHSGRRLWLYVLLEHQSEPDRWMRWRLLRYCCRIWERDRRRDRRRLSLRPIVPVVLYHGPSRWSWPREFAALFPAGMRQWSWLPHWEHLLIDLAALGPERVRGELKGRIAQLSMIAAYRDARRILRDVLPLLGELYRRGDVDDFGRLVLCIYATQGEDIRERFAQGLHRQVPGSGGEVMNYLEQLVERGRQEGQEGELATIERLVRAGVEWQLIESATRIDRAALRALRRKLSKPDSDSDGNR